MADTTPPAPERRTLILFVQDLPGVLNRVTSLFRRRNYNIDSLTVCQSETPGVSRMTIVTQADKVAARLIEANLYKLLNVIRVEDVTGSRAVVRDLALLKIAATPETRPQLLQVAECYAARVVDVTPTR